MLDLGGILKNFASDELSMRQLGWEDTRLVDGTVPLGMGYSNSGRGVGGERKTSRAFSCDFMNLISKRNPSMVLEKTGLFITRTLNLTIIGSRKKLPFLVLNTFRGQLPGPYPYPERDPLSPNAYLFQKAVKHSAFNQPLHR